MTVATADNVKFGRFAIRSKARKRIERATHGAAHFVGTWLVIDGRVRRRGQRTTEEQLARAQVRLGWGELYTSGGNYSATRFRAHVPLTATSAEIEAGWDHVAALVCAKEWPP